MGGHAIQITQRYIDVNDEQMRRAAELIGGQSCQHDCESELFESGVIENFPEFSIDGVGVVTE